MYNYRKTLIFISFLFVILLDGCAHVPLILEQTPTDAVVNTAQATPSPFQAKVTETAIKKASTPTQAPTATPSITPTVLSATLLAPGTIFAVEQGVYGSLLPIVDYKQSYDLMLPEQSDVPAPSFSEAIGLSNFSGQIAYVTKEDKLSLWMGDLRLKKVKRIWTDWDYDMLHYNPDNDVIQIRWGPGDQSIIVSNGSNHVISSLTNKNDMTFTGICDLLIWRGDKNQWSLACNGEDIADPPVLVNIDGSVIAESLPSDTIQIRIKDWAFSPDNRSVLYADLDGKLYIGNADGSSQALNFQYKDPYIYTMMRVLQWSADGERILIWGSDPYHQYCPVDQVCWFVIDVKTNKVIWHPKGEALNSSSDATLSPDGKWIVLFIMNLPQRYGAIVSLESDQMFQISNWLSEEVRWVK